MLLDNMKLVCSVAIAQENITKRFSDVLGGIKM